MTYCLAIDTSGSWCSVALSDQKAGQSYHVQEEIKRGHAEHILGFIDQLFIRAGFDDPAAGYDQLSRLAVVTGPGSFTGLRVGLSVARGIALAQSIPCVGLTSLLSVAVTASHDLDLTSGGQATVHAAIAGRGGQIFYQPFLAQMTDQGVQITEQAPAQNNFPDAIKELTALQQAAGQGAVYIAGSGAGLVKDALPALADEYFMDILTPSMVRTAEYAVTLMPIAHPPEPHYLRDADAVKAKAVFPLKPA